MINPQITIVAFCLSIPDIITWLQGGWTLILFVRLVSWVGPMIQSCPLPCCRLVLWLTACCHLQCLQWYDVLSEQPQGVFAGLSLVFSRRLLNATVSVNNWHGYLHLTSWSCLILNSRYQYSGNNYYCLPQVPKWINESWVCIIPWTENLTTFLPISVLWTAWRLDQFSVYVVLPLGPGDPPLFCVKSAKTGWFRCRLFLKLDPLILGGRNPNADLETCGCCPLCQDKSVPIPGSAFRISHKLSNSDLILLNIEYILWYPTVQCRCNGRLNNQTK